MDSSAGERILYQQHQPRRSREQISQNLQNSFLIFDGCGQYKETLPRFGRRVAATPEQATISTEATQLKNK